MNAGPHHRPSKAVPRAIAIAIVIGALTGAVWLLLDKGGKLPGETADAVADAAADAIRKAGAAVKEVLQLEPRVVESSTVVLEGEKATLEVALLETVEMAEYRYVNSWAGSTKVLHVRGRFRVKSGYKLEEGKWFMEKKPGGGYALFLPPPQVLSCEQEMFGIVEDADGYWNKLDKSEREMVQNRLQAVARQQARNDGTLKKTEEQLVRRLQEAAEKQKLDKAPDIQTTTNPVT